jgi:putative nucleotidyltransferase with HDIG domain
MGNVSIPPGLKEIATLFNDRGKQLYLVGGAVRDFFRGKKGEDWDLATDARPEEVTALFRGSRAKVIPTGIKHGTVTVHYRGGIFEITTFRTEADYADGRHPQSVNFAGTIEEDLSRRDFTMNALAIKLPGGGTVDPFEGLRDIKKQLIRCVGDPRDRFKEDGLRPLRAVRFASQLGFELDTPTPQAILPSLGVTAKVSAERIRDEMDKIIASKRPSTAIRLMEETGLLKLLIPELSHCRDIEQKGYHRFDVLDHSLLACDYAAQKNYPQEVRLAALFHDLGKPDTRMADEQGGWTFYQHEKRSAHMTEEIMTRLRYSNSQIERVCRLVRCHMFHYEDAWSDGAVRRFIIRIGEENLESIYSLRRADGFGMAGVETDKDNLTALISRVDSILAGNHVLSLKNLAISGDDLKTLGIRPGKYMGVILHELLETVVDDPGSNNRETLLNIAVKFNERYQLHY